MGVWNAYFACYGLLYDALVPLAEVSPLFLSDSDIKSRYCVMVGADEGQPVQEVK